MRELVALKIPTSDLKEYADYVNFLFRNESGVYNICKTVEDVEKSNKWFKNLPQRVIAVCPSSNIRPGDKFLAVCTNQKLNNKIFLYVKNEDDLIVVEDEVGEKHMSTPFLLTDSQKYLGEATRDELDNIVKQQSVSLAVIY